MGHNGTQNLIPVTERTKEEAKQISINGGIKSGIVRRKNKTFKETIHLYLDNKLSEKQAAAFKKEFPDVNLDDLKNIDAMILAQFKKAKRGDKGAAEFIRDTIGQKPVEKKEVTNTIRVISDSLMKAKSRLRNLEVGNN